MRSIGRNEIGARELRGRQIERAQKLSRDPIQLRAYLGGEIRDRRGEICAVSAPGVLKMGLCIASRADLQLEKGAHALRGEREALRRIDGVRDDDVLARWVADGCIVLQFPRCDPGHEGHALVGKPQHILDVGRRTAEVPAFGPGARERCKQKKKQKRYKTRKRKAGLGFEARAN